MGRIDMEHRMWERESMHGAKLLHIRFSLLCYTQVGGRSGE